MHMRMERAERRTQMLTDSFVVAGLWRTSSALYGWSEQVVVVAVDDNNNTNNDHSREEGGRDSSSSSGGVDKKEEADEDMLQFEMTND